MIIKHVRSCSYSRPFITRLTLLCVPSVGKNSMQVAQAGNQTIWKQVYREALFELEPQLLQSKLQAAQSAVDSRLFELRSRIDSEPREVLELTDAQRMLRYLQEYEQQT